MVQSPPHSLGFPPYESLKVKCVAAGPGFDCVRCSRLGLTCNFKTSNRGRVNVRRDVARLGPTVRALLKATGNTEDAPTTSGDLSWTRKSDADMCILSWRGHDCQKMMVSNITTRDGKLALIRHWLLIGVRSGSCALLGNVLILASECGLTLENVALQIDRRLTPEKLQLPSFIDEWFTEPGRICCARGQVEGAIEWSPNPAFVSAIGSSDFLQSKLQREHPAAASNTDFLVCSAEIFIATPMHPDDRMSLVELNSSLWSQVDGSKFSNCIEAVAPQPVRCLLAQEGGGRAYVQCILRGRTVVHSESRIVFSVFSFTTEGQPLIAASDCKVPVAQPVRGIKSGDEVLTLRTLSVASKPAVAVPPLRNMAIDNADLSRASIWKDSGGSDPFPPLMLVHDNPWLLRSPAGGSGGGGLGDGVEEPLTGNMGGQSAQPLELIFIEELSKLAGEELVEEYELDRLYHPTSPVTR